MGWLNDDEDNISKFEEFLVKLMATTNEGIHRDLSNSEDFLASHELDDYIHEKKGLDISKIEKNKDLTPHQLIEIGMNYARWCTHKNWHEVMDATARDFGVEPPKMGDHGKRGGVQVITDPSQLPDEMREVLTEVLGDIIKRHKRRGKK